MPKPSKSRVKNTFPSGWDKQLHVAPVYKKNSLLFIVRTVHLSLKRSKNIFLTRTLSSHYKMCCTFNAYWVSISILHSCRISVTKEWQNTTELIMEFNINYTICKNATSNQMFWAYYTLGFIFQPFIECLVMHLCLDSTSCSWNPWHCFQLSKKFNNSTQLHLL